MKNLVLLMRTAIVLMTILPWTIDLHAQDASSAPASTIVQVEGLTAEQRDALQQDLRGRSDLKIVFACVPAGLLVFEHSGPAPKAELDQRALTLVRSHTSEANVSAQRGTMDVERACALMRNR